MSKQSFLKQETCFCTMSIGPPQSGKSFLSINSILYWYRNNIFQKFYLILPNLYIEQNDSYKEIKKLDKKRVFLFTEYHDGIAHEIIDTQMKTKKKDKLLFLVDDSTAEGLFHSPILVDLACSCRHYNVNSWFLSHYDKSVIPKPLKAQIKYIFIYNGLSVELLAEINKTFVPAKFKAIRKFNDFLDFYDRKIDHKHGVLFINRVELKYGYTTEFWF